MRDQYVLGISAFYHDSAACLLYDGDIVPAAQEERFKRLKVVAGFPSNVVAYWLECAGIQIDDVQYVGRVQGSSGMSSGANSRARL